MFINNSSGWIFGSGEGCDNDLISFWQLVIVLADILKKSAVETRELVLHIFDEVVGEAIQH